MDITFLILNFVIHERVPFKLCTTGVRMHVLFIMAQMTNLCCHGNSRLHNHLLIIHMFEKFLSVGPTFLKY